MNTFLVFFSLIFANAVVAQKDFRNDRIVGGELTTIEHYPFQSALLMTWTFFFFEQLCGGTILNSRSILTAAHCFVYFTDPAHFRIRVGSSYANSGGIEHNVAEIRIHPAYNPSNWDSDVAVWQGPLSEQLRHVQVYSINQAICRTRYMEIDDEVTPNMLCSGVLDVGERDQCGGDSGGPLLHNGVVVGICSWGEECAHVRYPGVNVRVTRFANWIQSNA